MSERTWSIKRFCEDKQFAKKYRAFQKLFAKICSESPAAEECGRAEENYSEKLYG
jgi:hypothetical protein